MKIILYQHKRHIKGKLEPHRYFDCVVSKLCTRTEGTVACGVLNVDGCHWVSIVIDFLGQRVLAGNSQDSDVLSEDVDAFDWFADLIHVGNYDYYRLASTHQLDGSSCGVMALNAVAHYLSNGHEPLMGSSPADVALARLRLVHDVLHHNRHVSNQFGDGRIKLTY